MSDGLLLDAQPLGRDDRPSALARALERHLTFAPANFVKCADPIMLVGLPGTGKTAIAAKIGLAARLAERPFRLITLDGAKTGGMAQAEGFASSLGAELCDDRRTSPDESPEGRYGQLESASFAFLLVLEHLTPQQRAVLILRDVYEYSVREAAEALDLSLANVKTTLHRARRAMAAYSPHATSAARHASVWMCRAWVSSPRKTLSNAGPNDAPSPVHA